MNSRAESRRYSSPLRAEQAAATRQRILDAAIDLLQEADSAEVAIPEVAERAGVSTSTAYRAFPTREDLLDAVLHDLARAFEAAAGDRPTTIAELVTSTERSVTAVFKVEPLYRALFATPAGRELHRSTAPQRSLPVEAMLREEIDGLSDQQARRLVALVHVLTSSRSVLFLHDYHGLEADDIAGALHWALEVLLVSARDPERRADL